MCKLPSPAHTREAVATTPAVVSPLGTLRYATGRRLVNTELLDSQPRLNRGAKQGLRQGPGREQGHHPAVGWGTSLAGSGRHRGEQDIQMYMPGT